MNLWYVVDRRDAMQLINFQLGIELEGSSVDSLVDGLRWVWTCLFCICLYIPYINTLLVDVKASKVGATRNRPPYIISLVSTKRRKIWLSKKKKKKVGGFWPADSKKKKKNFKYIYLLYFFFVFLSFKAMSSFRWPWYFQFAHATSGPVKGHQLEDVWIMEIPASNSGGIPAAIQ